MNMKNYVKIENNFKESYFFIWLRLFVLSDNLLQFHEWKKNCMTCLFYLFEEPVPWM